MSYVEVTIDLDDISISDLVDYICEKIHRVNRLDKARLKEELQDLYDEFSGIEGIKCKTLDDKMKVEHLISVWDKYTSADLERILS